MALLAPGEEGWRMRALTVALTVLAVAGTAQAATPTFGTSYTYDFFAALPVDAELDTADIDGNARADLLVPEAGFVWVMPGTETGFDPNALLGPVPLSPSDAVTIAVADFTQDGLDDIVTYEEATDKIFLGPADSFGLILGCGCAGLIDLGTVVGATDVLLAAGDLDLDGDVDFVFGDNATQDLHVFRGDGGYAVDPTLVTTLDVSPAGIDEIVIGNFDTGTARPEIAVLLSTGLVTVFEDVAGNLSYGATQGLAPSSADPDHRMTAGDVTGDGIADLVATDNAASTVTVVPGGATFGADDPAFALAGAAFLDTADVNADGRAEVIAGTTADGVVHVLEGSASGALTEVAAVDSGGTAPTAVAAGDYTGDGRTDIVAIYNGIGLRLTRNTSLAAISPAGSGDLGSQTVGTLGAARTFALSNTGAAPLRVTSIRGDSDDFIVSGENCIGTSIAAGAACQVRVRFGPTAEGARSGTLTIAGNTAAPATVALSGTGTAAPSGETGGRATTGPQGPQGPQGHQGPAGRDGAPVRPVSRGHARCRVRSKRIQCVVYNAKTRPWRFNELRHGRLGHRRIAPGRYRLTVIHADSDGDLKVYRRRVRVR